VGAVSSGKFQIPLGRDSKDSVQGSDFLKGKKPAAPTGRRESAMRNFVLFSGQLAKMCTFQKRSI